MFGQWQPMVRPPLAQDAGGYSMYREASPTPS